MKIDAILENIKYKGSYTNDEVSFITDDSRKINVGTIFVCVKGRHFDGHDVAKQAQKNGAVLIVAERDLGLENQIIVDNSRMAYSRMAANFFSNPQKKLKFIGITGTNGKTTTAFLIRNMLVLLGKTAGLIGTVKNIVGNDVEYMSTLTTPEPFELYKLFSEMVRNNCEYCVMEVSSQALDQSRAAGLEFEAAVFTNLTQDHLDYHLTFENYAKAKSLLFSQTKLAVLNSDSEYASKMVEHSDARRVTYSEEHDSDYVAKNIKYNPDSVEYVLKTRKDREINVKVNIPGEFTVYNSMAAAAVLIELGFDARTVEKELELCKGVKGRIEVVKTDTDYTVIIDYAHSPDGLKNIIESLRKTTNGRIITVFGCGGDRDRKKRPIMGKIASELSDVIVVTSDNPRTENPDEIVKEILTGVTGNAKCIVKVNRTEGIAAALNEAHKGDTVLLAGKGHETYQIIGTAKNHYDEREIVKGLLNGSIKA